MSNPLTMECKVWADRERKRLSRTITAHLIKIVPKCSHLKVCIGGIRLPPDDREFWPSPKWFEHFAVSAGGLWRDEIYPDGLSPSVYRSKFVHSDALTFEEVG